jgi:hypothetical protein
VLLQGLLTYFIAIENIYLALYDRITPRIFLAYRPHNLRWNQSRHFKILLFVLNIFCMSSTLVSLQIYRTELGAKPISRAIQRVGTSAIGTSAS